MAQVEQLSFEWGGPSDSSDPNQVVIDPKTTEVAIALWPWYQVAQHQLRFLNQPIGV